jgi:hypothetical protein
LLWQILHPGENDEAGESLSDLSEPDKTMQEKEWDMPAEADVKNVLKRLRLPRTE